MKIADLETANRWLNDPRILPLIGDKPADLAPLWHDAIVFEFPTGTVGFHNRHDGDWHAHLCLIPGAGNAKEHAQAAMRAMFEREDCRRILGICDAANERTVRFGRSMGFEYLGRDGDKEVFVMMKELFRQGEST